MWQAMFHEESFGQIFVINRLNVNRFFFGFVGSDSKGIHGLAGKE